MSSSNLKEKLTNGKPTVGGWMQIPSASVGEIMGQSGYDWVAIDMEHGNFSPQILPDICRSLELGNTLPFVRVAQNHPKDIKHALEAGAKGIIVPMVENRGQMENAISWSLYPPDGARGIGYSRANLFGKRFKDYIDSINDELIIIAQIEHINAINVIDDILSLDRLDGIIIGPYDLSGSMGLTGQFSHPKFVDALKQVHSAARSKKIPMGMHIVQPDPDELKKMIVEGYQLIAYGTDAVFLYNGAQCPTL